MLEPIMARALAVEIRKSIPTLEAIAGLLEAASADPEKPVEDLYPRASSAALDGVSLNLQTLRDQVLEEAGLA